MKRFFLFATLLMISALSLAQDSSDAKSSVKPIEIAFLIDCSSSMTYALDEAKKKIVEIIKRTEANNPGTPLRVGFIRYWEGENRYSKFDLTSNPEQVFGYLNGVKAEAGTHEFAGYFVDFTAQRLRWLQDSTKSMYIVGNESPQQGPPAFAIRDIVPFWAENGFTVNSIYAGYGGKAKTPQVAGRVESEVKEWQEIAKLGKGEFINLYRG